MSGTTHIWRPSSARSVTIAGFAPVPRGAQPAVPTTLAWPAKDPGDVLDYQLDLTAALAGSPTDSIATLAVTVTPNAAGDLTINSTAVDGNKAVLWLAGGIAGTVYTLQILATMASGRAVSRSVLLPVLALNALAQPVSTLTTEQGAIVSDQNGNPILLGS